MQDVPIWSRRAILSSAGAAGLGLAASRAAGQDGLRDQQGERLALRVDPYTGNRERDSSCVGFPLYRGVTLLDFAGATQIFKFAGMTPIWLAANKSVVETTEGVSVLPGHTFRDHPHIDILFVPGGGASGVVASMFDPDIRGFLAAVAAKASWVGSVCTGAFILAAAGLLDGCKSTTYWSQIPNLKLLRDKLKLEIPDGYPRFVIDSDKKRFTGGGISSSMDLALALVSILAGDSVAQSAQLSVQYAPAPPTHAGDPAQAPAPLTKSLQQLQEEGFITPVREAVQRLLAGR